jgi:hypothetical protein
MHQLLVIADLLSNIIYLTYLRKLFQKYFINIKIADYKETKLSHVQSCFLYQEMH